MNNEQLSQIKDLIKNNKRDRFVIFDNEEPALVVLSIDEYKKIVSASKGPKQVMETDIDLVENINRAIAEWKANQSEAELERYEESALEGSMSDDNPTEDFYQNDENLSYYYDMDEDED